MENVGTGFGGKIHKGKKVKFVIHPLYGKITAQPGQTDYPFIIIPKCMGIRVARSLSLDHLYKTDEPVTCRRCK